MVDFNRSSDISRVQRGDSKHNQINSRKEKPSSSSDKDRDRFKKVMEKDDDPKSKVAKKKQDNKPAKKTSDSLFELSADSNTVSKKKSTPFAKTPKTGDDMVNVTGQALSGVVNPEAKAESTPIQPVVGDAPAPVEGKGMAQRVKEIEQIVDQIVNKLYVAKKEGITETLLTLKGPSMLQGAVIKLTGFDHAKGEFNLTFSNLTQEAKTLLETNQAQLTQTLANKGYTVHMFNATTETETIVASSEAEELEQQRRDRDRDEDEREQQG